MALPALARRKSLRSLTLSLALLWLVCGGLSAQPISEKLLTSTGARVAKAVPDECYGLLAFNFPNSGPPCFFSQPKANHSYPWSVTLDASGTKIVVGTAANPHCLGQSRSGLSSPYEADGKAWACEFAFSPWVFWTGLDPDYGDWRPPRVVVYDTLDQSVVDITPTAGDAETRFGLAPEIEDSEGLRFSATFGGLILMGGPALGGGVRMFAFDAATLEYLGSEVLPDYVSVRKAAVVDGELYVAISGPTGGSVLRWTGAAAAAPCDGCFDFEVVGELDGRPAYIIEHEDRLVVSTWPDFTTEPVAPASIVVSRPLGGAPLTSADAGGWTSAFSFDEYDPDPVLAASYAGGALASYQGYLVFGSMHLPDLSLALWLGVYGAPSEIARVEEAIVGTRRASALFRARNLGTPEQEIDLLYGAAELPAFTAGGDFGTWSTEPNLLPPAKRHPKFGLTGFWNPYNQYVWDIQEWNGRLVVGMFDNARNYADISVITQLAKRTPGLDPAVVEALVAGVGERIAPFPQRDGADLWVTTDIDEPFLPEALAGLGNAANWGVRNLIVAGDDLYAAMANPANLLTNPFDDKPEGGWELVRLREPAQNTPVGGDVAVQLGSGAEIRFCAVSAPGVTRAPKRSNFFESLSYTEDPLAVAFQSAPPETPTGFDAPAELFGAVSTAQWRDTCVAPTRAAYCTPEPAGGKAPALFRLEYVDSTLTWVPLPSFSDESLVCGEISDDALGLVGAFARNCDIDGDGSVEPHDIKAIRDGRGDPVAPGDPRDIDGDGAITVLDARSCVSLL